MFAIVEICSSPVHRSGVSKKTGNEYDLWFQEAFLHRPGQPYPEKFEFLCGSGVVFDKGRYAVMPEAIQVDRNGGITVRLEDGLKPLAAALDEVAGWVKEQKVAA